MIPRLKEQFNTELKTSVMEQLSLNNVNEIPTLDKIIINIGDGKAATDGRALESMIDELTAISGQKPVIRRAKKSIAGFKIREGMPIGVAVTLRGDRMWEFYDRFVQVVVPRIRDFRGFNKKSFDGNHEELINLKTRIEKLVSKDVKMRTFITDDNSRNELVSNVYDTTYGIIKPNKDSIVVVDDSIIMMMEKFTI